jgi:lipid II:glycine glycyltransferase (peptidoglycan interpeptide bridge formation enzyme)
MENNLNNNSNFLQSEEWRKFQESVGRQTFCISIPHPNPIPKGEGDFEFQASIIEHKLSLVGKYFYCPRGPITEAQSPKPKAQSFLKDLLDLAKKEKAGWIRIDPENDEALNLIKKNTEYKIVKASHDMQPREIFVIDITKTEGELLAEMKPKTRYNINLSLKRGVSVKAISNFQFPISNPLRQSSNEASQTLNTNDQNQKYISEFIRLVNLTENRKGIKFHSADYYQKMLEVIPENMLKLYVAEYNGKVIAANLIVFYGNTAIYLHGATDDEYRNVMAPYMLQWQAILDAKKAGYMFYDFGGISTNYESGTNVRITNSWAGITKFKLGFSPNTQPVEFPGSYDIIINPFRYGLYRSIQKIKAWIS